MSLSIALTKGRLEKKTVAMLEECGYGIENLKDKGRALVFEDTKKDIRYFAKKMELPVVKSCCPADGNTEREAMKHLLAQLESENRGLRHRIFGAMQRGEIDGFHPGFRTHEEKEISDSFENSEN